jgi:hypothetical protein
MSLRRPASQAFRLLRLQSTQSKCLRITPQFRTMTSKPTESPHNPLDPITLHRLEAERRAYYKRRSYYAGVGALLSMVAIWVTATSIDLEKYPPIKPAKMDSGRRGDDPMVVLGRERKVIVQKLGEEPEEKVDAVATGTSTVPTFPRLLDFVDDTRERGRNGIVSWQNDDRLVEYQLVGLGVRTVSFLGIEVYVVGMYVATDDIAALQDAMVRKIAPGGSILVGEDKDKLKQQLYDPDEGSRIWNELLKDTSVRTLMRIVPTRNTDFHHLRDAWVRSLTARALANREEFGDEQFGKSVAEFKALFNRGSVPKQKELLLSRDPRGKLAVWYDDGKTGPQRLGDVVDERISRAVWMNYLAGKTVASESARKSIIEGVMEFVERPVGTTTTQVQVHV